MATKTKTARVEIARKWSGPDGHTTGLYWSRDTLYLSPDGCLYLERTGGGATRRRGAFRESWTIDEAMLWLTTDAIDPETGAPHDRERAAQMLAGADQSMRGYRECRQFGDEG